MTSLRELFRIGAGPSSSHSMGPRSAAVIIKQRHPDARRFTVTLYGSLAATGRGHLTDVAIASVLAPRPVTFVWKPEKTLPFHPNSLAFVVHGAGREVLGGAVFYSVGGGTIVEEGKKGTELPNVYPVESMTSLLAWCDTNGKTYWNYVLEQEPQIASHLSEVWAAMRAAMERGLAAEGVLPGVLRLQRKAASYYAKAANSTGLVREISLLFSYALAVAEENASGGIVATAPTCGSAGVVPAVLRLMQEKYALSDERVVHALATAGIFGNIVKHNASISGAEVGCQGEIGTACAMAASAAAQLLGGTPAQIEYAAEMGLEHHLGLTCDPVEGLVQIPCIERNAMAAARALDCASYALLSDGRHKVSFDDVTATMIETGHDLMRAYRETAAGGLARHYRKHLSREDSQSTPP